VKRGEPNVFQQPDRQDTPFYLYLLYLNSIS